MSPPQPLDELLIEIQTFGHALRITAMDSASLNEIVFQAPVGTPMSELEKLAIAKMRRRLEQLAPKG